MSLLRLVSDEAEFRNAWEERPVLSRGLGSLDDVISLEAIDELLRHSGLRRPFFRMLKDGKELPVARYSRSIGEEGSAVTGLVDPTGVHAALADGATLVLQGLRLYLPTVAAFCDALSFDLGHPVHANAFLTPPNARGAGAHYDFHSVFIRQVCGRKRWQVQAPVEQWPRQPCYASTRLDTDVVLETWLEPGDCLYLPRGYVHDGWTEDEPSLHLTCDMIDPHMWASALGETLIAEAQRSSVELRGILPMRFADDMGELSEHVARHLKRLRDTLDTLSPEDVATQLASRFGPAAWDFLPPIGLSTLEEALTVRV